MDGTRKHVLTIIGILKGIRTEELASIMIVPSKYIEDVCQSLLKQGLIIRAPNRDGFTLKGQARNELLELIKDLRVAYIEEISKRMAISPELASYLCESLLKEGYLHRTPREGYMLKEDRDRVLQMIRRSKTVTAEGIANHLGLANGYVKVLCKSLMDDYFIFETSKGRYAPTEKDATKLLRLAREYGWAPIGRIVCKMKITPAYARLLCGSLAEKGYLKQVHAEAYALVGRNEECQ